MNKLWFDLLSLDKQTRVTERSGMIFLKKTCKGRLFVALETPIETWKTLFTCTDIVVATPVFDWYWISSKFCSIVLAIMFTLYMCNLRKMKCIKQQTPVKKNSTVLQIVK